MATTTTNGIILSDCEEPRYTVEASSPDAAVQLLRGTTVHGLPHYRVVVRGLVDKRHAWVDDAARHFGKALAVHIRCKLNLRSPPHIRKEFCPCNLRG